MIRRGRSRPEVIAQREVSLDGRPVTFIVRRSLVARQVRFEIRPASGLSVIIPRRCSLDRVDDMVRSKARWILSRIDRLNDHTPDPAASRLENGATVFYLGRPVRVVACEPDGVTNSRLEGESLLIAPARLNDSLEASAEKWFRSQASNILGEKAHAAAARLGVQFKGMIVRGQRTRWGSCSQNGTLSFNWRLIMAPEAVLDYVVVHEVAHLKEMNHTRRFWSLVAEHCPSWHQHRRWLNDHGHELSAVLAGRR